MWTPHTHPLAPPTDTPQLYAASAGLAAAAPARPPGPWPTVTIAAAAVTVLGAFLPWVTVDLRFVSGSVSGTDTDGVITLVVGGVVLLIGLLTRREPTTAATVVNLLGGLAIFAVGAYDLVDVHRAAGSLNSDFASVRPGIGLYLTALGGAGVGVGSVATLVARG
jgi:hypothetical protein